MERGAAGAIVNMSSAASQRPVPERILYSTSKAAVDQLTRVLAYELGPHKVRFLHVTHTPGFSVTLKGRTPLPVELRTSSLSIDTFAKKAQISFVYLRAPQKTFVY